MQIVFIIVTCFCGGRSRDSVMKMEIKENIQSGLGGNVNTLKGDSIGHCENKVHTNEGPVLNGYRKRVV